MPPFGPIKRSELIRQFRKLGFFCPLGRRKSSIYGERATESVDS